MKYGIAYVGSDGHEVAKKQTYETLKAAQKEVKRLNGTINLTMKRLGCKYVVTEL